MNDLHIPVVYLEDSDFSRDGHLVMPENYKNVPVMVMVQATWCPHCVHAKPDFQAFAKKYKGRVLTATIQADGGKEQQRALARRLESIIPGFRGFPHLLIYVNGRPVKQVDGRSLSDLENAIRQFL